MTDSNGGPPEGFREILDKLPLRVAMHVPNDVFEIWFPPGAANGIIDGATSQRARAYAAECNCRFSYLPDRREGVFIKTP
jgi:hypothetical protein